MSPRIPTALRQPQPVKAIVVFMLTLSSVLIVFSWLLLVNLPPGTLPLKASVAIPAETTPMLADTGPTATPLLSLQTSWLETYNPCPERFIIWRAGCL